MNQYKNNTRFSEKADTYYTIMTISTYSFLIND